MFLNYRHQLCSHGKLQQAVRTAVCLTLILSAAPAARAAQITLGVNAITNSDAETGSASPTGYTVVAVPGWTTSGNFTVVSYGMGSFPANGSPGPASRGAQFFSGGDVNSLSSASQVLDVSNVAAGIDGGLIFWEMSGYFGGWNSQNDNAVLIATFLNTGNATLGTSTIGGFTGTDRHGSTGLLLSAANGGIPVGTRSVNFTLTMTRTEGSYNDGYADNLSFIATQTGAEAPEPGTLALLGTGLGVLVWRRRKAS